MTKKDYFLLARILRTSPTQFAVSDPFVKHFMTELKKDNPNFSEVKFGMAMIDYFADEDESVVELS